LFETPVPLCSFFVPKKFRISDEINQNIKSRVNIDLRKGQSWNCLKFNKIMGERKKLV